MRLRQPGALAGVAVLAGLFGFAAGIVWTRSAAESVSLASHDLSRAVAAGDVAVDAALAADGRNPLASTPVAPLTVTVEVDDRVVRAHVTVWSAADGFVARRRDLEAGEAGASMRVLP